MTQKANAPRAPTPWKAIAARLAARRIVLWALLAATVAANCLPWIPYRTRGPGVRWIEYDIRWEGVGYNRGVDGFGARDYEYAWVQLYAHSHWYYAAVLTPAQVSLFAFWTAFGRKVFPWRLAYLLAIVAILTRMHVRIPYEDYWQAALFVLFSHLLVQAVAIVILLLVARAAGVRWSRLDGEVAGPPTAPTPSRFQFSLRALLWWVAGFAVLMSLWGRIVSWRDLNDLCVFAWWMKSMTGLRVFVALSTMWLVLGRRWWGLRLVVLAIAVIAFGGICFATPMPIPHGSDPVTVFSWSWDLRAIASKPWYGLGEPLWIAGSLLVLRVAGFRLAWHPAIRSDEKGRHGSGNS